MVVAEVVVDASVIVDLLVDSDVASTIDERLRDHRLHAPAHIDAEVLSALGRLHRAGRLSTRVVAIRITRLAAAPIERHPLAPLLEGAWRARGSMRLVDGLCATLVNRLGIPVVTTDRRLAASLASAELIEV